MTCDKCFKELNSLETDLCEECQQEEWAKELKELNKEYERGRL